MNIVKRVFRRLFVKPEFVFLKDCKQLARYDVGEYSHGHRDLSVLSPEGGHLKIGKFCQIARGVTIILGGEHRKDWVSTYAFPMLMRGAEGHDDYSQTKGDVTIGHDVWIGINSIIMSGVTLGDGMVVGAGSVVRRSFPPYSIVAGNPASLAGYRFPKEIIQELLNIRWWDWPLPKIKESFPLLMSNNIEQFVAKYRTTPVAPAVSESVHSEEKAV